MSTDAQREWGRRPINRSQVNRKALEADREQELREERDRFHAEQRAGVRARQARDPWRLPERNDA